MPTPNYVKDGLVLHLHAAKATGAGKGTNSPATTVWKDLSGNGIDCPLVNFAFTPSSGWNDRALNYDGVDDVIQFPDYQRDFLKTEDFTLEIWFVVPNEKNCTLFAWAMALPPYNIALRFQLYLQSNGYYLFPYTSRETVNIGLLRSFKPGEIGTLMQAVMTSTNGDTRLFINGIQAGRSTATGNRDYPTNSDKVTLGAGFVGEYHICRYYDRVLTPDEVAQNYNAGTEWIDANTATVTAVNYTNPIEAIASQQFAKYKPAYLNATTSVIESNIRTQILARQIKCEVRD